MRMNAVGISMYFHVFLKMNYCSLSFLLLVKDVRVDIFWAIGHDTIKSTKRGMCFGNKSASVQVD